MICLKQTVDLWMESGMPGQVLNARAMMDPSGTYETYERALSNPPKMTFRLPRCAYSQYRANVLKLGEYHQEWHLL